MYRINGFKVAYVKNLEAYQMEYATWPEAIKAYGDLTKDGQELSNDITRVVLMAKPDLLNDGWIILDDMHRKEGKWIRKVEYSGEMG